MCAYIILLKTIRFLYTNETVLELYIELNKFYTKLQCSNYLQLNL